jgi:hypothetical protein
MLPRCRIGRRGDVVTWRPELFQTSQTSWQTSIQDFVVQHLRPPGPHFAPTSGQQSSLFHFSMLQTQGSEYILMHKSLIQRPNVPMFSGNKQTTIIRPTSGHNMSLFYTNQHWTMPINRNNPRSPPAIPGNGPGLDCLT